MRRSARRRRCKEKRRKRREELERFNLACAVAFVRRSRERALIKEIVKDLIQVEPMSLPKGLIGFDIETPGKVQVSAQSPDYEALTKKWKKLLP
jgi:hypothetical protein